MPFPGLEEELTGSARDLEGITVLPPGLQVVRAGPQLMLQRAVPHTVQAIFACTLKEPPHDENASEEQMKKLAAAERSVLVAVCLPAGYALMRRCGEEAAEGASDSFSPAAAAPASAVPLPLTLAFSSPLLIKDSLHSLLMAASPVYAAHKADEVNRKLMQLFMQQADG